MATISWISRLYRHLVRPCPTTEKPPDGTKDFHENRRKAEAFDSRDRGIRTVPLARIVGSVGRYQDFDDQFRMKRPVPSERLERVRKAMREGIPLPPVKLYQIKDEYYVLDGNHRIAAARSLGHDEILGRIVEFIPSSNNLDNLIYRERSEFADRTGLEVDINLSEVGQYTHLLKQIEDHRQFLTTETGKAVSVETAAADWHRTIYKPLSTVIRRSGLLKSFPGRTLADLYAYISVHQWEYARRRRYGIGIDRLIPRNMEEFREKMKTQGSRDYPEMKRTITAFVLMNVQARREFRIIERLFELEEVQEIHSVHGDVDLLVKIELIRDLLSSDAEIISGFVHKHVRQIAGVNATQTLIPGISKTKPAQSDP